jgi:hypothetical protein
VPYLDRLACDVRSGINRGVPQAMSYTVGVFSPSYKYPLVRLNSGVEGAEASEATTAD